MANASFMSMRWLRLHIKEIIWATVSMFVLSCFIIGYGTQRAARNQEEKQNRDSAADRRAREREDAVPANLVDKLNMAAIHISLPTANASITQMLDVKTLYNALKTKPEYKRLLGMPPAFRSAFGAQLRESVIEELVTQNLIGLYARAHNIQPPVTAQTLVDLDRKKLTAPVFDRKVREAGMTTKEYGDQRLLWETIKQVLQTLTRPVAAASATDDFLKKNYEENKIRFKKDDEIGLRSVVVSPGDFAGKTAISEDEIKQYYDVHRADFKSSKRASVFHMVISPDDPDYLKAIPVEEGEIRRRYTVHIDDYKEAEQVQARHILFKPRNSFEKDLDSFSISLRKFALTKKTEKNLYTFELSISKPKPGINLKISDITLITASGTRINPTPESMALVDNPVNLPVAETLQAGVHGSIAIEIPRPFDVAPEFSPVTLEIKDRQSTHLFDVSVAHDADMAFAAAEESARKMLDRLTTKKEDFAKMAEEFSEDIASRNDGGSLGFFARGQMVKPFEEAAFGAAIGEIKGPVKSNFGYHLIKVEGRKAEHVRTLDDVRKKLISDIKREQAQLKAESDLQIARDLLDRKSQTFGQIAKKYSMGMSVGQGGRLPLFFKGDITDDYSASQANLLTNEIGDSGKIIPEIETAVFELQPGELSPVIKTQVFNEKGEPVVRFHLFQLESFLEPVTLGFNDGVKTKIREVLEKNARRKLAEEKAKEFASKVSVENFGALASDSLGVQVASFGALPFSLSPGFSNFALTTAVGQLTVDGHTFLPALHKSMLEALKGFSEAGGAKPAVVGPVETELGFHFFVVTSYKSNQYTPFEEVKEKLRNMLVQVPSEGLIKKEFESNREKLDEPPKRKIRQIILSSEEKAQEIYKALKNGEIFSLLAKRHSIDGSGSSGGYLGEVAKGQLPAALEEAVWKLNKGEYTSPVQVSYGFVIAMQDEDEKPAVKATLTPEIQNKLKQSLKSKFAEEFVESFLVGLRNSATIVRNTEVLAEL